VGTADFDLGFAFAVVAVFVATALTRLAGAEVTRLAVTVLTLAATGFLASFG
jgi:hypothetical protein